MIARILLAACVLVGGAVATKAQNRSPAQGAMLELVGPAGQRQTVSASDLAKFAHVDADVSSHNVRGRYRGVPLGELLRLVGRAAGDSLRGAALADAVVIEAMDGYRAVFALAELDSGFTDKMVLLADAKNGSALDSVEGPFRVIAVGEKRPARWVRGVIRIRVVSAGP